MMMIMMMCIINLILMEVVNTSISANAMAAYMELTFSCFKCSHSVKVKLGMLL